MKRMKEKKTLCMLLMIAMVIACAPCALARSFSQGDTGDEVAVIQQALEDIELYYADVTGHYGKRTAAAVKKFQKKYNLPQTGVADEDTRERLYLAAGVEDVAVYEEEEEEDAVTVMRQGSQGSAVRQLQEDLRMLEYYTGSVTGSYGRLTKEAVRLFQRDHDLSSDGVAGPRTLEKLSDELGEETDGVLDDEETDEEETKLSQSAVDEEKRAVDLDDVEKLNTEWTLRLTSRSGYVKRLQRALLALGYFSDEVDGRFGSKTEEAVKAYQLSRGLTVDGIAGRATLRSINEDVENGITASSKESVD